MNKLSPALVLQPQDLFNLISKSSCNQDIFTHRLRYLKPEEMWNETHHTILDDEKIVAIASTQKHGKETQLVKQLSIDPAYQGRRLSRVLLHSVFEQTAKANLILDPTYFSRDDSKPKEERRDGETILMPLAPKLHQEHPDLWVRYDGNEPINGHRPYRLSLAANDYDRVITFI